MKPLSLSAFVAISCVDGFVPVRFLRARPPFKLEKIHRRQPTLRPWSIGSRCYDVNQNKDIEKKRLKLVTDLVRRNNSVVIAEQLAPFCDDLPDVDENDLDEVGLAQVSDDSQHDILTLYRRTLIIPIVAKLDGEPVVTADGDIV